MINGRVPCWCGQDALYGTIPASYSLPAQTVALRHKFEFMVICSMDFGFPDLKCYRFIQWRLETEIEDLNAIDIGLMPLPDGEWEMGKAGFKAIQYSAVEAVPIVSCVGAGPSVVIDEQTGFVVDNATVSWSNAIERLLDNPGLVVEMGKQGREFSLFSLSRSDCAVHRYVVPSSG